GGGARPRRARFRRRVPGARVRGTGRALLGPLRARHHRRHHAQHDRQPHRARRAGLDGVPDPRRPRGHAAGRGPEAPPPQGGRRGRRQQPAPPVPGRRARRDRPAAGGAGDDRAGRRLPRRPGRRLLEGRRRRREQLGPRSGVHARDAGGDARRPVLTLEEGGRAVARLGSARRLMRPVRLAAAAALALLAVPAAADDFVCTEVLGVSVTGDWFGAGFEKGLDDGRWQVRWRSKAFVELWADPASDLWALPAQSPCTRRSDDPDRVIFTAVNWEWKTREEWESRLEAALATIRAKRPGARRIELMTMLRAPGNQTCGSVMTVVQPYVDE